MGIALLIALALAASPASTAAEQWELVTATPDGSQIFIDDASFQRAGDRIVVAERRDNSRNADSEYLDVRMVSAYDCAAGTFQLRSATATPKSGAGPISFDKGVTGPFSPVGTGTVAAAILKHVCAKPAK